MSAPLPSLLTSLSASIGTCESGGSATRLRILDGVVLSMVWSCQDKSDAAVISHLPYSRHQKLRNILGILCQAVDEELAGRSVRP